MGVYSWNWWFFYHRSPKAISCKSWILWLPPNWKINLFCIFTKKCWKNIGKYIKFYFLPSWGNFSAIPPPLTNNFKNIHPLRCNYSIERSLFTVTWDMICYHGYIWNNFSVVEEKLPVWKFWEGNLLLSLNFALFCAIFLHFMAISYI